MEEGVRKEKQEGSITKKKRGKTLEEKKHRHAPSANRFASDLLLEGKILYCLGYVVNHTDEESVQCR